MRALITHFQLALLLANFVVTTSFIQFPITQVVPAGSNGWFVFFLIVPFPVLLILLGLKGYQKLPTWNLFSDQRKKHPAAEKGMAMLFIFFITLLLLNDVQSFISAIQLALLPMTSTIMTTIIIMLLVSYVAKKGIGTIANFNGLFFFPFVLVMSINPINLLPKIDFLNVVPILNPNTYFSLMQAVYNAVPWAGEIVILYFILGHMQPLKYLRLAAVTGTIGGLAFLYVIIFLEIGVFGSDLLSTQVHPTLSLIRELAFTEQFDRLDLVLFLFWIPTVFAKLSLEVYVLFRSIQIVFGIPNNNLIYLIGVVFGLLRAFFFRDNMNHYQFFLKANSLGGIMTGAVELLIVLGVIILLRLNNPKETEQP